MGFDVWKEKREDICANTTRDLASLINARFLIISSQKLKRERAFEHRGLISHRESTDIQSYELLAHSVQGSKEQFRFGTCWPRMANDAMNQPIATHSYDIYDLTYPTQRWLLTAWEPKLIKNKMRSYVCNLDKPHNPSTVNKIMPVPNGDTEWEENHQRPDAMESDLVEVANSRRTPWECRLRRRRTENRFLIISSFLFVISYKIISSSFVLVANRKMKDLWKLFHCWSWFFMVQNLCDL